MKKPIQNKLQKFYSKLQQGTCRLCKQIKSVVLLQFSRKRMNVKFIFVATVGFIQIA